MAEARITITAQDAASATFVRVNGAMRETAQTAEQVSNQAGASYNSLWDRLKTGAGGAVTDITSKMGDFGAAVQLGIENPMGAAKHVAEQFGTDVGNFIKAPVASMKEFASGMVDYVLDSFGPIGIAAGVVITALSGMSLELIHLANDAEKVGAQIGKMAQQFNIPVEQLSNMRFAVNAAGGDFNEFGNQLFMFQNRMENMSEKVDKGLKQIGLSVDDVSGLNAQQQFLAISDAFRSAGDNINKSAVAFDIFGKQGRDMLPMLLKPLSDLEQQSADLGNTWSRDDVAAARAFQGELAKLGATADESWTRIGRDVAPVSNELVLGWEKLKTGTIDLTASLVHGVATLFSWGKQVTDAIDAANGFDIEEGKWPATIGASNDAIDSQKQKLKELKDQTDELKKNQEIFQKTWHEFGAAKPITLSESEEKQAIDETTEAHKKQQEEAKKAAAEEDKLREAMVHLREASEGYGAIVLRLNGETSEAIKWYLEHGAAVADLARVYGLTTGEVEALSKQLKFSDGVLAATSKTFGTHIAQVPDLTKHYEDFEDQLNSLDSHSLDLNTTMLGTGEIIGGKAIPMFSKLTDVTEQLGEQFDLTGRSAGIFTQSVSASLDKLPEIIERSFEGGGGLTGAIKAFGSNFGAKIGAHFESDSGPIASLLPKSMDNAFGKALGSLAGGLAGGAIGMGAELLGKGISALIHIGGPSKKEMEGRGIEADFEKSFGGFNNMMHAVGAAYDATGRSAKQAQADVAALMAAEKLGGDAAKAAIDKINQAFSEQKQDATDLDAAIQQYGFTIDELGPTMQRQKLAEQGATLENQWRLLVNAGIDVSTVTAHMSGAMNDYLHTAMRTGTEVPSEMQPIIQKMIDMGQLTDDSGNKILNMKDSGLTFSETMTQGFDKVVKKLDDLLKRIGMVPSALDQIPTERNIDVHLNGVKTGDWDTNEQPPDISAANEAYDLSRPVLARVGDNPLQSESVLHASTVRDIVRASKQAGAGADVRVLQDSLASMTSMLKGLRDDFRRRDLVFPSLLKDALA